MIEDRYLNNSITGIVCEVGSVLVNPEKKIIEDFFQFICPSASHFLKA